MTSAADGVPLPPAGQVWSPPAYVASSTLVPPVQCQVWAPSSPVVAATGLPSQASRERHAAICATTVDSLKPPTTWACVVESYVTLGSFVLATWRRLTGGPGWQAVPGTAWTEMSPVMSVGSAHPTRKATLPPLL